MDDSPKGTISHGVVNQMDQFPTEQFSSPLNDQIFELCNPELLSEVNSKCSYDENFSYSRDFDSIIPHTSENNGKINTAPTTTTSTANSSAIPPPSTAIDNNQLSIVFDSTEEIENGINSPIDLSTFPQLYSATDDINNQQNQFVISSIPSQNQLQFPHNDIINLPLPRSLLPSIFEDEGLSFMPPNMRLNMNPTCLNNTFLEPFVQGDLNSNNSVIFTNGLYLNNNNEIQIQDLDFQGANGGMFCPDGLPRIFNPNDLQEFDNESQNVANGGANSNPLASDLSSLDDSTYKIHKLSPEERREKIHRYMKKRNERNFSKKIKYACRKTLADSRPRVRGRFAKNDELLTESLREACGKLKEEPDELDHSLPKVPRVVKEEELFDSSDIFAHISGVNSFKGSYNSIPSWI